MLLLLRQSRQRLCHNDSHIFQFGLDNVLLLDNVVLGNVYYHHMSYVHEHYQCYCGHNQRTYDDVDELFRVKLDESELIEGFFYCLFCFWLD